MHLPTPTIFNHWGAEIPFWATPCGKVSVVFCIRIYLLPYTGYPTIIILYNSTRKPKACVCTYMYNCTMYINLTQHSQTRATQWIVHCVRSVHYSIFCITPIQFNYISLHHIYSHIKAVCTLGTLYTRVCRGMYSVYTGDHTQVLWCCTK